MGGGLFKVYYGNLYSSKKLAKDLCLESDYDGQSYKVTIAWSKLIATNDVELYSFFSIFFKSLLNKMKFEKLGRKCFQPSSAKTIQGLEVWPGFFMSLTKLEKGPMLMIDYASKVIRQDTVLQHMAEMQKKH